MKAAGNRIGTLAPLALGAVLASHAGADAKTEELGKVRLVGPEPTAGATPEAARAHGRAMLAHGNVLEALQSYRQALAQDPDSVDALNGIAVCYDRLGRFEDSRLHYEAALGIDPTAPMLLNNYGLSLYLQGHTPEATRFLRLAAAAGDPAVQAASLRILARIDQGLRPARPQQQIAQAVPRAATLAETGPRVVRTSGHEVRLVLEQPRGPAARSPAARSADPQSAVAHLPVETQLVVAALGELTPRDDARIAVREADAVAAEAIAQRLAALAAAATPTTQPQIPAEMELALRQAERAATSSRRQSDLQAPFAPAAGQSFGPDPAAPDWHRDQILLSAPASATPDRSRFDRASLRMALLASGLAPPRRAQRAELAAEARAGLDPARRAFLQPFESDNGRLNSLAGRLHGAVAEGRAPDVAEQIARLEALIAQVRSA